MNRLLRLIVRAPEDFPVVLGTVVQEGTMFASVTADEAWHEESWRSRVKAIATADWSPDEATLYRLALKTARREVFGEREDFAPELIQLTIAHSSREWDLSGLTDADKTRANGLNVYRLQSRVTLGKFSSSPSTTLQLRERAPWVGDLALPMIIRVPVIAVKWFFDIHFDFACAQVRRSGHSHGDQLISYLYETLFLQQKTALCLSEYARLASYAHQHKDQAMLIRAEIDTILYADLLFSYLRATVEKTMALLAFVFGVDGLQDRRNHAARIGLLTRSIPTWAQETDYGQFALKYIGSDRLADINSYRLGILHKAGIADLQPHSYVDVSPTDAPFMKLFATFREEHAMNTVVLMSVCALLVDVLVTLVSPTDGELEFYAKVVNDHETAFAIKSEA